jgi:Ca2+-binding EF-hand superfamily protein
LPPSSGLISKHEFAKAMAPLGIQVSKEEAGAL